MVSFCTCLATSLAALSLLGQTLAVPLADKLKSLSPGARGLLKRSTPAAPRFVVYSDTWTDALPTSEQLEGYNVYALSFLLSNGATDMALGWEQLSDSQRASYLQEYNTAGISLIVSAFGSTETPTTSGVSAVAAADYMASWVQKYNLQGVDTDYEDFSAFDTGAAESWLISFTRELRSQLPQGQYLVSHAPVAPWFSPSLWSGGGYLRIDQSVGSLIDWYNVQFYNQGTSEYTTCAGLLTASSSTWPESALFQISDNGVPLDKLVIGKPALASDANDGWMPAETLASCVSRAHSLGWAGGVMVWQYHHGSSAWINTVRGRTF